MTRSGRRHRIEKHQQYPDVDYGEKSDPCDAPSAKGGGEFPKQHAQEEEGKDNRCDHEPIPLLERFRVDPVEHESQQLLMMDALEHDFNFFPLGLRRINHNQKAIHLMREQHRNGGLPH